MSPEILYYDMRTRPLQTVFFDAGGTILHVRTSVGQVYADVAGRLGYPVDADEVEQSFASAWKRSLARRRTANYISSDDVLRREWRVVVSDSFDGKVPPEIASRAFEELYDHFSGPDPWIVAEGVLETFDLLRSEGIKVGLLSNWDGRLPGCLEELGIRDQFDHQVISYEVGVEKPHPRIFREAAIRAGAEPRDLLMVGDSLEQDMAPALELGWDAIWLTRDRAGERPAGKRVKRAANFQEVLQQIGQILRR